MHSQKLMNDEMNLKNIARNEVSIFLYRFELRGNGIDFVVNEAIAEDMYPDIDEKMKPLVHACCETLLRYRHLSVSNTIMDSNILVTGELEFMLSKGLGQYFAHDEKERLFQDAKNISDLLGEVMDRGTKEMEKGIQRNHPPIEHTPNPRKIKKGLEKLGKTKHLQAKSQWLAEGVPLRPGLRQLRPEDLPPDVTTSRIKVEQPVTRLPPHRSLRAELPHRALQNCSLCTQHLSGSYKA
jgi:hypothetical protein